MSRVAANRSCNTRRPARFLFSWMVTRGFGNLSLSLNISPRNFPSKSFGLTIRVRGHMNVILMEHNKLWFAAKARNWRLAEYQLGEIKEVMGDVQDLVPTFKNLPLADMLDAVITKEISALEKSIEAKDYKTFVSGYDKLTQACNACHQGTENEFIVIQRPARPAFTNQVYDKRR